jgi:hypothetical protein
VVGVVVGGQEDLAEDGLAVAVRDFGVEVDRLVAREVRQRVQVAPEIGDALAPRGVIRRCSARRPVARWELGRDMLRVARELEDVPLRDPEVLE